MTPSPDSSREAVRWRELPGGRLGSPWGWRGVGPVMIEGNTFEKAGVNRSTWRECSSPEGGTATGGADPGGGGSPLLRGRRQRWWLHPRSPMVPHGASECRYFEITRPPWRPRGRLVRRRHRPDPHLSLSQGRGPLPPGPEGRSATGSTRPSSPGSRRSATATFVNTHRGHERRGWGESSRHPPGGEEGPDMATLHAFTHAVGTVPPRRLRPHRGAVPGASRWGEEEQRFQHQRRGSVRGVQPWCTTGGPFFGLKTDARIESGPDEPPAPGPAGTTIRSTSLGPSRARLMR